MRHEYASNQQGNQGFKFQMKTLCNFLRPLSHFRDPLARKGIGDVIIVLFPGQETRDSKNE